MCSRDDDGMSFNIWIFFIQKREKLEEIQKTLIFCTIMRNILNEKYWESKFEMDW